MSAELEWLDEHKNVEIAYYRPYYGDDDDQDQEWRVYKVSGPINDREWDIIGRGQTSAAALRDAMKI